MDIEGIIHGISIWAVPVVLAVILHEVAHGWVADRLGDDTARWMGRLTLNPLKHLDPVGTVLIPLLLLVLHSPFLFGYARPVPVNFNKLRRPKQDMVWVAMAGPATNLILAFISSLLLALVVKGPPAMDWLIQPVSLMCQASIIINMVLCIFNLLPLPPLDGGRIAVGLLPEPISHHLARLEPFGFFIIIALLLMGLFQNILGPVIFGISNVLIHWALAG